MRLRLAVAAALAAVLIAAPAAAQTVTVGSRSANCGQSFTVPVTISSVSGLLSVQFDVSFDGTMVQPTGVTAGSLTSSFSLASNITGNTIKIAMASGSPVSGSGTIANISFTAAAAAEGSTTLGISGVLVNDVAKTGLDGTITLSCPKRPNPPTYISPADGATNVAAPVTLRWNASTGADTYDVYFGATSPAFYNSTSATSLAVETATGTTYTWYIRASNEAGTSDPGQTWTFTTSGPFCATPGTPQISGPATATSGVAYEVSWTAATNTTEYVLEEAGNASFTGATSTTTSATKASFTRSVAGDTPYYYRVRGRNGASGCNVNGSWSGTAAVVVSPRPPIPAGGAVLVVAGSAPGAFGAMFRTALQLHNPTDRVMRGKIVFHPAGSSGSDSDPSLPYELQPGQTLSFPDLLPAMGIEVGLGSIDIVPDAGTRLPVFVTRIFNDAGDAGTSGMTLDMLGLDDVLFAGDTGIIITPIDPAKTRMNIGIRALAEGVAMTVRMRNAAGTVVWTKDLAYPAVYFMQTSAELLLGTALVPDGSLAFSVTAGSALVYGSTTDNVTNDPNVQIARPID